MQARLTLGRRNTAMLAGIAGYLLAAAACANEPVAPGGLEYRPAQRLALMTRRDLTFLVAKQLHGPGALNDEYEVEAVFDEYLVLSHEPSGIGEFLALDERHPSSEVPRDREETPHD